MKHRGQQQENKNDQDSGKLHDFSLRDEMNGGSVSLEPANLAGAFGGSVTAGGNCGETQLE